MRPGRRLSVFAIVGDIESEAENLALIAIDELFERGGVPGLGCGDQQVLIFKRNGRRKAVWVR